MRKSVTHIFGNEAKVKMMRLFVFNPTLAFDAGAVSGRVKESPRLVRRELSILLKSGLIRQRGGKAAKPVKRSKNGKKRGQAHPVTRRAVSYVLNSDYPYLEPLANFLVDASPMTEKEIMKKLSRTGVSVKLILLAGVFNHDPEARVDLLIVGDHIKRGQLVRAITEIEAELGKEIRYAVFDTADFKYRLSMYDKLVRDILDYPYNTLVDKIGLPERKSIHFLSTVPALETN